jgi:hypothetical protein
MNSPTAINNLEGLSIEAAEGEQGFGFALQHQDGHYPSKLYLFPTK